MVVLRLYVLGQHITTSPLREKRGNTSNQLVLKTIQNITKVRKNTLEYFTKLQPDVNEIFFVKLQEPHPILVHDCGNRLG